MVCEHEYMNIAPFNNQAASTNGFVYGITRSFLKKHTAVLFPYFVLKYCIYEINIVLEGTRWI